MVESENKRWAHLPPIVKNLYNEKVHGKLKIKETNQQHKV